MTYEELADKLDVLQMEVNPPMGVSCIRSICHELRHMRTQSAQTIARSECDKLSQYPDIIILIHENLADLGCYYVYAKYPRNEIVSCCECCKPFHVSMTVFDIYGDAFCSVTCHDKKQKREMEETISALEKE